MCSHGVDAETLRIMVVEYMVGDAGFRLSAVGAPLQETSATL